MSQSDYKIHQFTLIETGEREDDDDLEHLQLIEALRDDMGVTDAAMPLLLHMLDELYGLRHEEIGHRPRAA